MIYSNVAKTEAKCISLYELDDFKCVPADILVVKKLKECWIN